MASDQPDVATLSMIHFPQLICQVLSVQPTVRIERAVDQATDDQSVDPLKGASIELNRMAKGKDGRRWQEGAK